VIKVDFFNVVVLFDSTRAVARHGPERKKKQVKRRIELEPC